MIPIPAMEGTRKAWTRLIFLGEPGSLSVVELDIRRASMPDTALERRGA